MRIIIPALNTNKFLKAVLGIQLATLYIIALDSSDIEYPGSQILRPIICFIYLTIIPGAIIAKILKLRNIDKIEYILYVVGLSISFLMIIGFIANLMGPLFGIVKPISLLPLVSILSTLMLASCLIIYKYRTSYIGESDTPLNINQYDLFLLLLPILSIFGTQYTNYRNNSFLLIIMIWLLSLIPIYTIYKSDNHRNYAYHIFIISLSLIFHGSMISQYIFGTDLCKEYYVSNWVALNGAWDHSLPDSLNGVLSIAILAPIYSIFLDISLTWIFKLIYPLLFALVPVGLFVLFRKQTDDIIAFMSCFFFVSLFTMYTEMLALARQQIAEFFLVLLLILIIDSSIRGFNRAILISIFSMSVIVSHYSISFIYIFVFSAIYILIILFSVLYQNSTKLGMQFLQNIRFFRDQHSSENKLIHNKFILFFIVFTVSWYLYVSSSAPFNSLVYLIDNIYTNILNDFLNPDASEGLKLISEDLSSNSKQILKYLHLISIGLISLGLFDTIAHYERYRIRSEFIYFSLAHYIICVSAIFLPFFGGALNTTRLYHIALIILSPYFIIGGICISRHLFSLSINRFNKYHHMLTMKSLAIFLSIYLLFNTGFVAEVFNDSPYSYILSGTNIINHGSLEEKASYLSVIHTYEQDVIGARWLLAYSKEDSLYYSDLIGSWSLISYGMAELSNIRLIRNTTTNLPQGTYIRLSYPNIAYNVSIYREPPRRFTPRQTLIYSSVDLDQTLFDKYKIYTSGLNIIYHV